ncbi:glucoamylase family protein [uncultured Clostridium sp.]|uniref:GH36-type glycosyl hydrolase domain-containing protein n=1 Tax=uncultured Clostridium sp. TaxID=59620 RepID=UPI0025DD54E5|nr:glucoamylase family protein [uncultured Clostridium sp.]
MYYFIIILVLLVILIASVTIYKISEKDRNLIKDIPFINSKGVSLEERAKSISLENLNVEISNCRVQIKHSVKESYETIINGYNYFDNDIKDGVDVIPPSEWLLDNIYILEKEHEEIRTAIKGRILKELPVISDGAMRGFPRIYFIAVEIVGCMDGKIDISSIERFVREYEENVILTSKEIWALPIMIRIALMHRAANIVEKMVYVQKEKALGNIVGEEIVDKINSSDELKVKLKEIYDDEKVSVHFVERVLKVLRDNEVEKIEVYKFLEKRLHKEGTTFDRAVTIDHNRISLFGISLGNTINSIRTMISVVWAPSFESLSYVEKDLRRDPLRIYEKMDFDSREKYRLKIEELSNKYNLSETFISDALLNCAEEGKEDYSRHIGYYLLGDGENTLREKLGIEKKQEKIDPKFYINSILLTIILLASFVVYGAYYIGYDGFSYMYIIAFLCLLIPCSEIVLSLINWIINNVSKPTFIPKLQLENGIPDHGKTIVVIPTMIDSKEKVDELLDKLEIYSLSNEDKNLYFALLGDFKDSLVLEEDGEEEINNYAVDRFRLINRKYGLKEDKFYYFNRKRVFNDKEEKYIGWERKRGKLVEFAALIRGDENTTYNVISGDLSPLKKAQYIITLDSDTILPRDCAKRLIGSMLHPLNQPIIKDGVVVKGYGIMQPRINITIESSNKTLFSKVFSGEIGMDIYTLAISDVYMDLFGEGIFTGKGIFHIDTFNEVLKDKFQENQILSHDLIEGSYLRTALLSDTALFDSYPSSYMSYIKRLHRWVRGDWQLLPYILKDKKLNAISKWKMIDNLRRSLLTPSIIILFLAALLFFKGNIDTYISIGMLAIFIPMLFDVSEAVVSPMKGIALSGEIRDGKTLALQIFLLFAFLPYCAYRMIEAISVTLYRLVISKKHLLQWVTAEDTERFSDNSLGSYISNMWFAPIFGLVIAILSYRSFSNAFELLLLASIIWILSPILAFIVSRSLIGEKEDISEEEERELYKVARKTYCYFEDFVNEENNYLPPDNYQEDPYVGVAHRTSPTNIGMGLMANVVAYDMGFIFIETFLCNTEKIINSVDSLEKYKGHLYNWYDTLTKKPLHPLYVSTVDSGNLICYLWVLKETIKDYITKPIDIDRMLKGMDTVIGLCDEELRLSMESFDFYDDIVKEFPRESLDIESYLKCISKIYSKELEIDRVKREKGIVSYWNSKLIRNIQKEKKEILSIYPFLNVDDINSDKDKNIYKDLVEKSSTLPLNQLVDFYKKAFLAIESKEFKAAVKSGISYIEDIIKRFLSLKEKIEILDKNMNLSIMYDKGRELFAIGYDVEKGEIGNCYYDLLASEARGASFVAVAKGEVPSSHWFKLGRSLTNTYGCKGLVSWSGTMFEYMMPLIIMKSYKNTIWSSTYHCVVKGQIDYGDKRKVPWGISESGYYLVDKFKNYQYKAHGVPGLGLKRGLREDLVISPYSTIMAMMVDYDDGFKNLKALKEEGFEGKYGFYEAIDYTKERLPKNESRAIVKSYMVHHQGMALMSLNNVLNDFIFQKRFHNIKRVKATELYLQERVPNKITYSREVIFESNNTKKSVPRVHTRNYSTPFTDMPECGLLSNGVYSVMVTNSGSGYSKKEDMDVYRFKEDVTLNESGMFFYIKDVRNEDIFSPTYQPTKVLGNDYRVSFALDKIEFKKNYNGFSTSLNIAVLEEDNGELREIDITNNSGEDKIIEVTSYMEVTLANYGADAVHPAFSNLFINTEFIENPDTLLANRRPRSKYGNKPWVMQKLLVIGGEDISATQYETSRVNFIGRGNTLKSPAVIKKDGNLSNTVGAILDPIMSLRKRIRIKSAHSAKFYFLTAIGESREEVINIGRKYNNEDDMNRIFTVASSEVNMELNHFGLKYPKANLFNYMASKIIYLSPLMRKQENEIKSVSLGQMDLWQYGISGDNPIVLLKLYKESDREMLSQMLMAHEYWRRKGLNNDLVILDYEEVSYYNKVTNMINEELGKRSLPNVYSLKAREISKELLNLLEALGRIVIDSKKGLLATQVKYKCNGFKNEEKLPVVNVDYNYKEINLEENDLLFFNGYGGFKKDTGEYVIIIKDDKNTPAPWINVISNDKFGTHISELGSQYTWCGNSRENKLTPWNNDWIKDSPGEVLYIRDEYDGEIWSATAMPIRHKSPYIITHGFGYSKIDHYYKGIYSSMKVFVPKDKSVKCITLTLKNESSMKRKLGITYFATLVMGVIPEHTYTHVYTEINNDGRYILGRNPYGGNFKDKISYLTMIGVKNESFSGDRKSFLGREGEISNPKGLKYRELNGISGAGIDPALITMGYVTLEEDETKEITILLGEEESIENIDDTIKSLSTTSKVEDSLEDVKVFWRNLLGKIEVNTPDKSMDLMVNGWLMYQDIACRVYSRTAFYQSGGAYGFRDQLQDVMSLSYLEPVMTRKQIIYSSSRQYLEGDVQHWWHPIVDSGIRTRFSDDLLWLPYVTADYIKNTGDYSVLLEETTYLEDEPLKEGEDERYSITKYSNEKGTIYEHCIKAIERGLKFGEHNIPLMGSGDWNDGMSEVGNKGKGESVWLGWFIYSILNDFIDICEYMKDEEKKNRYLSMKEFLRENLEENAWDGKWYKRAYFDDGTPLGSKENDECMIDSLGQTWAVISGAGSKQRIEEAMNSLEKYLVKESSNMILLFTPPFNNSKLEPGYIKGYVPGVRENGGQYTHAATWVILAYSKMHKTSKAFRTFNMINPITHTKTYGDCNTYKTEPYVVVADIYSTEGHIGRGGWSWYTGSAGWLYRGAVEGILGLKLKGKDGFIVEPCIPDYWDEYTIKFTRNNAKYNISIERGEDKGIYIDNKKVDIISYDLSGEIEVKVII